MIDVLVVDDDAEVCELIRYSLPDCVVRVAANGEEARRAVAERAPDVVLLDIMMPGGSGLQVLGLWRAEPATAALPVILLTAKAQEADIDRGFAMGADDYVVKPFSPLELARRVTAVSSRSRRGR